MPQWETHTYTLTVGTFCQWSSEPAEAWLPKYRGRLAYALRDSQAVRVPMTERYVWKCMACRPLGWREGWIKKGGRREREERIGRVSRCLFQPLPKIAIWMNDPVSGRLNPLLLFLHGFLTAEHTQGELIDSGLHHGPKLPLHKTMLPGRPLQIVKTDHGLFPFPLEAHWVAVVLHVLAPRVIFLYRVLPLKNIIPIRLLLLAAGERIRFVFHGVFSFPVFLCGKAFRLLLGRVCALKSERTRRELSPVCLSSLSLSFFFFCLFVYVLQTVQAPLPPVRVLQTETECPRTRWIRFLGLPPSTDGPGLCRPKPLPRLTSHGTAV